MDNIGNIVREVIDKMAQKRSVGEEGVERIWQNVLNKDEIKHTRLIGFNKGVLAVAVDSPTMLYALKIKKNKILNFLKEHTTDIQEIYFKVGKVK